MSEQVCWQAGRQAGRHTASLVIGSKSKSATTADPSDPIEYHSLYMMPVV